GITPDCTFNEKDIELHVYSRDKRNGIILKKEILKNYDLFKES
nr:RecName: Full=Phospholipase A1; Short=PLA1; AltName: Allergen=Pol g 1 [Polistes gallicus]